MAFQTTKGEHYNFLSICSAVYICRKNKSKRIRYCPEAGSNTLAISKTKCNLKCNRLHFYKEKQPEINKTTLISGCCLVEAMGVEPMSEKSSV